MDLSRIRHFAAVAAAGVWAALPLARDAAAQTPVKDHYTVSGGLLGAANYTRFRIDNGTEAFNWNWGWAAGLWLSIPAGKVFSFEPQVQYSSWEYEQDATTPTALLGDATANYLSVPVLFKFHLGKGLALLLGPQFDFLLSVDNTDTWEKADVTSTSIAGTAGLEFAPRGRISLYARYMHGFTDMDDTSTPTTTEFFNQGFQAGLKLRLFGSHVPADSDGDGILDTTDQCATVVGLERYQGCPIPDSDKDNLNDEVDKCPQQAGTQKYEGCPIPDTDKDGINDEQDRCPNEPGTAQFNGCQPPDTDNDGIRDPDDRCPTEPGTQQYNGCPPPDQDRDGILDSDDRCPTVAGVREQQGCPAIPAFTASAVTFASGRSALTAAGRRELDKVVSYLNENSQVKVMLTGHTDNTGSDEKNQKLSEARAQAAKQYLVSKGIDAARITASGQGESQPAEDNGTAAGRAANRRVEVTVQ
ncbi:MAG TPA: OmpA family protein [Gemmatimonadales bacterium]|nr:OmpA family protein [Gemmatimonadales bacterium]